MPVVRQSTLKFAKKMSDIVTLNYLIKEIKEWWSIVAQNQNIH